MQCEQCREQFSDLYEGRLSSPAAEEARQHLASCPRCNSEYEEFAATVGAVRALDTVMPPAHLLDCMSAELDRIAGPTDTVRRLARLAPAMAAAACFALVFLGIFTYNSYQRQGAVGPGLQPAREAFAPEETMRSEAPVPATPQPAAEAGDTEAAVTSSERTADVVQPSGAVRPAAGTEPSPRPGSFGSFADHPAVPHRPPAPERHEAGGGAGHPPAEKTTLSFARDGGVEMEETGAVRTDIAHPPARPPAPAMVTTMGTAGARSADEEHGPQPGYFAGTSAKSAGAREHGASVPLPETGKLFVRFIPPQRRMVNQPVTCAVVLTSDKTLPEANVRVETRHGVRLLHSDGGSIYRGPLGAGEPQQIECKLVAERPGTQRLRVSVETPVSGLQSQMEVILPGFEVAAQPPQDPLGGPVSLVLNETPLREALLQIAREGRINLVVTSDVGGERVTYSCVDTPAGAVVRILAGNYGYQVEFRDDTYYISLQR